MKLFKKIITFVCIVTFAFAAFACGPDIPPDDQPDPPEPEIFTVTYNVGEHGVAMASETFGEDDHVAFEDPVRKDAESSKGYEFVGWYKSANFVGLPIFSTESLTGDATVYANWQVASYPISYTLNGGIAGSGAPSTYTYFEATTLIPATRNEYRFDGWYSNQGLTNGPHSSIPQGEEGAKRFYAKWAELEADEFSISYVLDGGRWSISTYPQNYKAGDEVTIPSPVKTGFRFEGWFTAATGGTEVTKIATTDTGAKTFYARWSIITYTITYHEDGGTFPASYRQTYTYTDDVFYLPVLTKTDFNFGGWYNNSGLTGNSVSSVASNSTGNLTFYAKWTAKSTDPEVTTTTKFEAENVDLRLFVGAGYSGSKSGTDAIVSDPGASAGRYVGWMNSAGLFIDFVVNSDRAVSNATIALVVNFEQIKGIYECNDVTIGPEQFSVIVSGVECQYTPTLVKAGDDPEALFYTTITINNVNLVSGSNVIRLRTNVNTLWGGDRTAGPGIDCISITTTASLTWTPWPNDEK